MANKPLGYQDRPSAVVHISRAKRLKRQERPALEPLEAVRSLWTKKISDRDKSTIVAAEIRADMQFGDPNLTAIRKALYVIEHADAAFTGKPEADRMVAFIVTLMIDYGEPECLAVVKKAMEKYKGSKLVRDAVSSAVARFGNLEDCYTILSNLSTDLQEPAAHLSALVEFTSRFPEARHEIVSFLEPYASFENSFAKTLSEIEENR